MDLDLEKREPESHGRDEGDARNGTAPRDAATESTVQLPADDALKGNALRALGAVAAGVGVVGFVAVVGGADYWLRFSSAGLPADETVVELSRSQLLVVGTRILAPFLGIAIVEVVILYLLETWIKAKRTEDRHRLVTRLRLTVAGVAVCIAVAADAIFASRITLPALAVLFGIALVLALIVVLYAADAQASITKFIVAALMATALFALVSGASITAEAPDLRAVALVVNGKPLAGIYVGSSTDQVFVGEVCLRRPHSEVGDTATGSVIAVPRKQVSVMLVGANAGLEQAIAREQTLLSSLQVLAGIPIAALRSVAPRASSAMGGVACTSPSAAALSLNNHPPDARLG